MNVYIDISIFQRDERRIKKEDKFESAAILMSQWRETDKAVEQK